VNTRRDFVIGVVAAFLFGCSVGALAGLVFAIMFHSGGLGHGPRLHGPRPLVHQLERRLELDDAQRARIDDILARSRERYDGVRESTRVEIERTLTPRQLVRWREMERRFHRLPPGVPGPPGLPVPPGPEPDDR
jgi:hypothetical protein